ncbi:bifunctional folylpolyglutamate synthase/dihydrofolate synthase [Dysgonomonadaceae bacterium zrk40]|nr:bifunctional folylpolyglutamate synthase/dihydrofolate synthase [Dysgonomonadaceae bacterium zrk40]
MTYEETLDYLYNQMPEYQRIGERAYKVGLDNSLALDRIFGHPHRQYKTIHVAGTNGKGSTSHLLAAILQESGYRVGLYTSPHLTDFRERIRVNGEMIDKAFVVDFTEQYREQFEPVMPSFFELTMEMAFLWFAKQKVDVAVIETGLGGRLDSTNIITPVLSIITNIGLDHMKFLGDTLPQIAAEKAGIIKPGVPVVIGEKGNQEVEREFRNRAASVQAPIHFAEEEINDLSAVRAGSRWIFNAREYPSIVCDLGGFAQQKNARTLLTAVALLQEGGLSIPRDAVYRGFSKVISLTGLRGRWQQLQEKPKIICDIAHNAHGLHDVKEQLESEQYKQLHMVFGMANDKDTGSVLSLLPTEARYYFTRASVERALDEQLLREQAVGYDLKGECFGSVAEAVAAAMKNADENDLIFIGGSSFVVADTLPLFD